MSNPPYDPVIRDYVERWWEKFHALEPRPGAATTPPAPAGTIDVARDVDANFNLLGISALKLAGEVQKSHGAFLREYVQNSDDAGSERFRLEVAGELGGEPTAVRAWNDGAPFEYRDVMAACNVMQSPKVHDPNKTGYLGVGIKATFQVANVLSVHSKNTAYFRFSKQSRDDLVAEVAPEWIESPPPVVAPAGWDGYTVHFELADLLPAARNEIRQYVHPDHFQSRTLLFLRHLRSVEFADRTTGYSRRLWREVKPRAEVPMADGPPLASEIVEIVEDMETVREGEGKGGTTGSGVTRASQQWLVVRREVPVPADAKRRVGGLGLEEKFAGVETLEVVVAFRLDADGNLVPEPDGTVHLKCYSCQPLKRVASGLNFLLETDLVPSDARRGELFAESTWNAWALDALTRLVKDAFQEVLVKHPRWKLQYLPVLHAAEGGEALVVSHVKTPLRAFLLDHLLARDGSLVDRARALVVPKEHLPIVEAGAFAEILEGRRCLHPDLRVPPPVAEALVAAGATVNFNRKDDPWAHAFLEHARATKNVAFFREYYSRVRKPKKFLTAEFTLVDPARVVLDPDTVSDAEMAGLHLVRVHPALAGDAVFREKCKAAGGLDETSEKLRQDLKHLRARKLLRALADAVPQDLDVDLAALRPEPEGDSVPASKPPARPAVDLAALRPEPEGDSDSKINLKEALLAVAGADAKSPARGNDQADSRPVEQPLPEKVREWARAWSEFPEERRFSALRELFRAKRGSPRTFKRLDLQFLTLDDASGKRRCPADLFFPDEYDPPHVLAKLARAGFFTSLTDPPRFVNPKYLPVLAAPGDGASPEDLRAFFRDLGVDSKLADGGYRRMLVRAVGTQAAIAFEEASNRQVKQFFDEDQTDRGYDIEGDKWAIECKGRSRPEPALQMTANEVRAMIQNPDTYRVYLTTAALENPVLHVIGGQYLAPQYLEKFAAAEFNYSTWKAGAENTYPVLEIIHDTHEDTENDR